MADKRCENGHFIDECLGPLSVLSRRTRAEAGDPGRAADAVASEACRARPRAPPAADPPPAPPFRRRSAQSRLRRRTGRPSRVESHAPPVRANRRRIAAASAPETLRRRLARWPQRRCARRIVPRPDGAKCHRPRSPLRHRHQRRSGFLASRRSRVPPRGETVHSDGPQLHEWDVRQRAEIEPRRDLAPKDIVRIGSHRSSSCRSATTASTGMTRAR